MDEKQRLLARDLLLRARIYKFLATLFACAGIVIFLSLYFRNIDGNLFNALARLSTVMTILLPFLPAFIFSWLASRAETRLGVLLEGETGGPERSREKK